MNVIIPALHCTYLHWHTILAHFGILTLTFRKCEGGQSRIEVNSETSACNEDH